MSSRKFASLTPEERAQVIDGIHLKLLPQIVETMNKQLALFEPEIRKMVRAEIGKWAVSETQARAFIDGMMLEAAKRAAAYFSPRWVAKILFRSRV